MRNTRQNVAGVCLLVALGLTAKNLELSTMKFTRDRMLTTMLEVPGIALESDQEKQRPYFVLHVGLPKAMSTTLQCKMRQYRQKGALHFNNDTYEFLGKIDPKACGRHGGWPRGKILDAFRKCGKAVGMAGTTSGETCWKNYTNRLVKWHQSGINIVASEEKFGEFHIKDWRKNKTMADFAWKEIKKSLRDWDFQVVVIYRRYYSWLGSLKN